MNGSERQLKKRRKTLSQEFEKNERKAGVRLSRWKPVAILKAAVLEALWSRLGPDNEWLCLERTGEIRMSNFVGEFRSEMMGGGGG